MARSNVAHDGMSRTSLQRESFSTTYAHGDMKLCRWCGQSRPVLFRYINVNDDNTRPVYQSGDYGFCNLSCYRSFSF